jgi:hypothetical protein
MLQYILCLLSVAAKHMAILALWRGLPLLSLRWATEAPIRKYKITLWAESQK